MVTGYENYTARELAAMAQGENLAYEAYRMIAYELGRRVEKLNSDCIQLRDKLEDLIDES